MLLALSCSKAKSPASGSGLSSDGGNPALSANPCVGASCYARSTAANPIPVENAHAGEPHWRSGKDPQAGELELYASIESVEAGDPIAVRVSTDKPQMVDVRVYRVGYYNQAGARLVLSGGSVNAGPQAPCPRDSITSEVACAWTDTFQFTVGSNWVSGTYVVKVTRADGVRAFSPFVVRDHRAADILFQPSFNTYQAYNNWGGEDLYLDSSHSMPSSKGWRVSYDRPYSAGAGAGELFFYEYWLIQLMESQGYDVTYGSNLDFSRFANFLGGIGAFVVAGHDEYWTVEERAAVEAATAAGTSVAYFGANGGYWRARAESNAQGARYRSIACYKDEQEHDPLAPGSTVRYRDPPSNNPENGLWGIQYENYLLTTYPLVVKNPAHWMFRGLNLTAGTLLPNAVGDEYDNIQVNGFSPAGLEVSMESPLFSAQGVPGISHTVDRFLPAGNLIFAAGSINWAAVLNVTDPAIYDGRIALITLNVLEQALKLRRPPRALQAPSLAQPQVSAPVPSWASSVSWVAGTPGVWGWKDGPASSARFSGASGIGVLPTGELVVADTRNNVIRLVGNDPNHTVSTIAGNGQLGYRDGMGAQAMFRAPDAIAVAPSGVVYVADSLNSCIRRLEQTGQGWSVSTYAGVCFKAGYLDGPANVSLFNIPNGVALDSHGNLFVADTQNSLVREVVAGLGEVVTIAGEAEQAGSASEEGNGPPMASPTAVAVGPDNAVYVVEPYVSQLWRIEPSGDHARSLLAGDNSDFLTFRDGVGSQVRWRPQAALLFLGDGSLLVADNGNNRIRKVTLNGTGPGTVTTYAGSGAISPVLGSASSASLANPAGLALAADGSVLVSDGYNGQILRITP
jgi:hypothetical protein